MDKAMCVLGFTLLLGAGLLVEAVQDPPALKAVFKDAFVMGTAVDTAIVPRRRVIQSLPAPSGARAAVARGCGSGVTINCIYTTSSHRSNL